MKKYECVLHVLTLSVSVARDRDLVELLASIYTEEGLD